MTPILQALLLQAGFIALVLAEIVLPSGGLLSVGAVVLFAASWWPITASPAWALPAFALADLILIPVLIYAGLRWMRRSPIANSVELGSAQGYQVDAHLSPALMGQVGSVLSVLRPSGKVQIGSEVYEALSSGGFVEAGTPVVVRSITENKLIVEPQTPSQE